MTSIAPDLPVIDHPDVDSVLVGLLETAGPAHQWAVAEGVTARWRRSTWPADLLSLNCYVSTDGRSVLTYAQWRSGTALDESVRQGDGVSFPAPGIRPVAYRLHKVVRGTAFAEPLPRPECFPANVFEVADHEAARRWIDHLLELEEAAVGADRAYPGGLAANFHVSIDGTKVLIFSEWVSEQAAVDHMNAVIEHVLGRVGETDGGPRYRHYRSFTLPEGDPR